MNIKPPEEKAWLMRSNQCLKPSCPASEGNELSRPLEEVMRGFPGTRVNLNTVCVLTPLSEAHRSMVYLYSAWSLPQNWLSDKPEISYKKNQSVSEKVLFSPCLCLHKGICTFRWHGTALLFSKKQETESSRWKIAKWGREGSEFAQCRAKPTGNAPSCEARTGCDSFALILRKSGRKRGYRHECKVEKNTHRMSDVALKWRKAEKLLKLSKVAVMAGQRNVREQLAETLHLVGVRLLKPTNCVQHSKNLSENSFYWCDYRLF